jgi:hypothetical protein
MSFEVFGPLHCISLHDKRVGVQCFMHAWAQVMQYVYVWLSPLVMLFSCLVNIVDLQPTPPHLRKICNYLIYDTGTKKLQHQSCGEQQYEVNLSKKIWKDQSCAMDLIKLC